MVALGMSHMSFDPDAARHVAAFVTRAAALRQIWVVSGNDGYARVTSPTHQSRQLIFAWTDRAEASRWADVLVRQPRIQALSLRQFLAETLPMIAATGAWLAPDWSADPIEPEIESPTLGQLIRQRLVDNFAAAAHQSNAIWLLRQGSGFMTLDVPGESRRVLPVWASRDDSQHGIDAIPGWSTALTATPVRIALSDFTNRHLLTCAEQRWRLAPAFIDYAAAITLAPWDLKGLLNRVGETVLRVA